MPYLAQPGESKKISQRMRGLAVLGAVLTCTRIAAFRLASTYSARSRISHRIPRGVHMSADHTGTSVLMICLGNICRSPTAEAVLDQVVKKKGQASQFRIDSCGTGGGNPNWYQEGGWSYHEGEPADERMATAALKRGVELRSTSRPLKPEDIDTFDYLICMDGKNKMAVLEAASHWGKYAQAAEKVRLMTEFCQNPENRAAPSVPDPYYGGPQGFERVLDLLEDACEGLYKAVVEKE